MVAAWSNIEIALLMTPSGMKNLFGGFGMARYNETNCVPSICYNRS